MATIYGNRWETIGDLGEGGQAHTFLVRDLKGGGEVHYVLKRLKNANRIQRFKQEIEAVRALAHPHIVSLLDFDLAATKPYFVSEYCAGGPLSKANREWFSQPEKAFCLFLDICNAVLYAHNNGVIHRDLKPDNIFLRTDQGPAVVGDFGICHLEAAEERFTDTFEAVGPRIFMAPELEDGRIEVNSSKSDIYSLGKILYWLLTKGRFFSREKYRDQAWDLKAQVPHAFLESNIYMEHVTRLLDHMIVNDIGRRAKLEDIIHSVKRISKLIELQVNPVSSRIPQQCTYCGWGTYRLLATRSDSLYNFGIRPTGNPEFRIFICKECGHIQMFRLDETKPNNWWVKDA